MYIYMYIYMCIYMYIYVYIIIQKEGSVEIHLHPARHSQDNRTDLFIANTTRLTPLTPPGNRENH